MSQLSSDVPYFFIYDHTRLQREEDDLKDAIVLFLPPTVSETEQCLLVGQLMGLVTLFRRTIHTEARIFTLRSTNQTNEWQFACQHHGRFTVAYGISHRIPALILQQQLDSLMKLSSFYEGCLECFLHRTVASFQRNFMRYLAHITCGGDNLPAAFGVIPKEQLNDTANFLQIANLLQNCSLRKGVLGGCLIFRQHVVFSELPAQLTNRIALIQPHHVRACVNKNYENNSKNDTFETSWLHLREVEPPITANGVALIRVYVHAKELDELSPYEINECNFHSDKIEFSRARSFSIETINSLGYLCNLANTEKCSTSDSHKTCCSKENSLLETILYVQAYSAIHVAILLKPGFLPDSQCLQDLWHICGPGNLSQLETQLVLHLNNETNEVISSESSKRDLQFDKIDNTFTTEKFLLKNTYFEEDFNNTAIEMHCNLMEDNSLLRLSMGSNKQQVNVVQKGHKEIYSLHSFVN